MVTRRDRRSRLERARRVRNATEAEMERRQFLRSTVLGAAATMLGIAPSAAATTPFPQENIMSEPIRPYEPLTFENAALVLVDHQVGRDDERNAHRGGEGPVLEVRRVVRSFREEDDMDAAAAGARGRRLLERAK